MSVVKTSEAVKWQEMMPEVQDLLIHGIACVCLSEILVCWSLGTKPVCELIAFALSYRFGPSPIQIDFYSAKKGLGQSQQWYPPGFIQWLIWSAMQTLHKETADFDRCFKPVIVIEKEKKKFLFRRRPICYHPSSRFTSLLCTCCSLVTFFLWLRFCHMLHYSDWL